MGKAKRDRLEDIYRKMDDVSLKERNRSVSLPDNVNDKLCKVCHEPLDNDGDVCSCCLDLSNTKAKLGEFWN